MERRAMVAFALAALGLAAAEGRVVPPCELRDAVGTAIGGLSQRAKQKGLTVENLAAKIVCHVDLAAGFNTSAVNQLTPPMADTPEQTWTLHGLFQLSNHLVCSDGVTPSPDICGIDCSELTDDAISDDIACLLTVLAELVEKGFTSPHWEKLSRMVSLIFQEECLHRDASHYFAGCP